MIICTQCGEKNSDKIRFCEKCGKKLQSSRQPMPLSDSEKYWMESFKHKGISPVSKVSLWRMLEAWGYIAVLAAVAVACSIYEIWWPLYPVVGVLGLVAWFRRV